MYQIYTAAHMLQHFSSTLMLQLSCHNICATTLTQQHQCSQSHAAAFMALAPRSHCSIHSATFTLHLCSYIHAAARVLQRSHSFFNTTAFVQQLVLPLSRHHTYDAPHMQQHFGSSIHAASLTLLLFCHGILRLCSRIEAFTLQLSRNPSAGGRGLL